MCFGVLNYGCGLTVWSWLCLVFCICFYNTHMDVVGFCVWFVWLVWLFYLVVALLLYFVVVGCCLFDLILGGVGVSALLSGFVCCCRGVFGFGK